MMVKDDLNNTRRHVKEVFLRKGKCNSSKRSLPCITMNAILTVSSKGARFVN